MTDVTPHPTAKLRAMNDFKSALANLELQQSDYNTRNFKAACEQLIASSAVSEEDQQEPFASVISWEEKQAIEQVFRIAIDSNNMFDAARKVASTAPAA
jgi:hypothetical protein